MKSVVIPFLICLLAQTAWPTSFFLSKFNLVSNQLSTFIAGVVCLLISSLGPVLILRRCFVNVNPLMYVFSVFAWSCMVDLGISLELEGFISNFIGYYFVEGEPYLNTVYGSVVCLWDGVVHFFLCIGGITLYSARKSHREVGLYWAGSILNSMVVLVPGGITGNHPFKTSILLNIPYFFCPLLSVFKLFNERTRQSQAFIKHKSIWQRPIDLMFILYFSAASVIAVFRGLAVLGGNAEAMHNYLKNVEPYLTDPTNFPRAQILVYEYFYLAYYIIAIYGLVCPGQHWMADWSLLHAGAAAQAQFCHITGSIHHRTTTILHAPVSGTPGLICWTINIALAIVPQLFAWHCLSNKEMFGRTNNAETAEFRKPSTKKEK